MRSLVLIMTAFGRQHLMVGRGLLGRMSSIGSFARLESRGLTRLGSKISACGQAHGEFLNADWDGVSFEVPLDSVTRPARIGHVGT